MRNSSVFFSFENCLVLNRVMKLLHMDSHINLQNLRWPFHTRYSVPTILGTPTSLTVQSTIFGSLRGNITQNIQGFEISRSHDIDLRYGYLYILWNSSAETIYLITFFFSQQLFFIHHSIEQKLQSIFEYGAFNKSRTRFRVLFTHQQRYQIEFAKVIALVLILSAGQFN